MDDEELTPTEPPGTILTYHGQNWLEDLSLLAPAQGGQDVWRLAPSGFDAHGNPIFTAWTKVLTDPIFAARPRRHRGRTPRRQRTRRHVHQRLDGRRRLARDGYYVQARGGRNFSANEGPQHKITRYVPDGAGATS